MVQIIGLHAAETDVESFYLMLIMMEPNGFLSSPEARGDPLPVVGYRHG